MNIQMILATLFAICGATYLLINRHRQTKPRPPWSAQSRATGTPEEESGKTNTGLTADAEFESIRHTTLANRWRHLANSFGPAIELATDNSRKGLAVYNELYENVKTKAPHAWPTGLSRFLKWTFYVMLLGSSFALMFTAARIYEIRGSELRGILGLLDTIGITPPFCVAFAASVGFLVLGTMCARQFQAAAQSRKEAELAPSPYAHFVHAILALVALAIAGSLAWFWADLANMAVGSVSKANLRPSTGSGFIGAPGSGSSNAGNPNPEWTFRVLMIAEFALSWIVTVSTSSPLGRLIEANRRSLKLALARVRCLHWSFAWVNRRAETHAHLATFAVEERMLARKAAASWSQELIDKFEIAAVAALLGHSRAKVPTDEVKPIDISGVFGPTLVSDEDEVAS